MAHNIVYFSFICICLFHAGSAQLQPWNDPSNCVDGWNDFHFDKYCPGGLVTEYECQTKQYGIVREGDMGPFLCPPGFAHLLRYNCICDGLPTWVPPGYTGPTPTAFPPWYTGPTGPYRTPAAYPPWHSFEKPGTWSQWDRYTGSTPTTSLPFLAMLRTRSSDKTRPTTPSAPRSGETSTLLSAVVG